MASRPVPSALAIDGSTGALRLLNQQSSGGNGPCHVAVDREGKCVLVANYGGGSVAVLSLEADGRLGRLTTFIQHEGSSVNPGRQKEPHAHSINLDAANRYAFVADLGLDKILVYRFSADQGTLAPHDPPAVVSKPGAGPRHFAFHPGGQYAYVINELDSTVTALSYDSQRAVLTPIQSISTLPEDFSGDNTTAEVQVHPSGRYVYGSNRGHDSIVVFAADPGSGRLTYVEHESTKGENPRNFAIDPTGEYLLAANQDSDNVVVFRIDKATGQLEPTQHMVKVSRPVCVKMMHAQ